MMVFGVVVVVAFVIVIIIRSSSVGDDEIFFPSGQGCQDKKTVMGAKILLFWFDVGHVAAMSSGFPNNRQSTLALCQNR